MRLNRGETRALRVIERLLRHDDPELAGLLEAPLTEQPPADQMDADQVHADRTPTDHTDVRLRELAGISLGAGIVLLVLGIVVSSPPLGLAGWLVLVLVSAPLWGATVFRSPDSE